METPFGALQLSRHKTAFSPAHKALFVADVHLGKAATFRSLGVPVPAGTTQENLDKLSECIAEFNPLSVYFLGDLLHAKMAHNPDLLSKLMAWRVQHANLTMTLIRGNHDKRAGDPPESLNIRVVPEPLLLGPFALQHEPDPHPERHVLAGHVHPVYRLNGKGRQSLRLACFRLGERISLLPAFGAFTGGYPVEKEDSCRIFVIGDNEIWPVS